MHSKDDILAKAVKTMILTDPFYGLLLISLNKIWDKRIPTACVGLNNVHYQLRINEDFFVSLTPEERIAILKHELLHIGFSHLIDYDHLTDKEIANYAMDLEINQMIENLPECGITLDSPGIKELNLQPKAGTNYYYKELLKNKKADDGGGGKTFQELMDMLNDPNHDWDKEMEGVSDIKKEVIKNQLKEILNNVAEQVKKNAGTIPGEFAEILEKLNKVEPAKFNWRDYVRRFVGISTKQFTKKTKRKESKRFIDNPGIKVKMRQTILFAIDTSASVSTTELKEMQNELIHLSNLGNDIVIIQCDTQIRSVKNYSKNKDLEVHGRGGTSFEPVIMYYNENISKYNCLIYYTDGEASRPSDPKGPVLWVLSSRSAFNNNLPGRVIKLPE